MYEQAIRNRWDIPPEMMAEAIETTKECLRSHDERTKLGALRIVTAMVGQNQKDEHKFVDMQLQSEHARLDVVADELGIDKATLEGFIAETGGDSSGVEDASRFEGDEDESR